jgi:tetratricopeptide (TPR) repeat protein
MLRQGRSFSGHERNCVFLNLRRGDFATLSATSGLDFPDDGRAVSLVDWDHDGDLDLWIANRNAPRLRLMLNGTPTENRSIGLLLVGNGTTTNRDAIGARVEVIVESSEFRVEGSESQKDNLSALNSQPSTLIRTVRAGEGFLAQSSKWLHFGLGDTKNVEKIVVRWPGGESEEFSGADVGGHYRLVQGTGQAQPWDGGRQITLAVAPQQPLPDTEKARLPLSIRLPLPALEYETFSGSMSHLSRKAGQSLWLVLWASWCQPCLKELAEIVESEDELRAAGIDVVALAVDGVGADKSDPRSAAQVLTRMKFPFRGGRATARLLYLLQDMHDYQVPTQRSLPVPSSFLIDSRGDLVALYKGPTSVSDVMGDLRDSAGGWQQRFMRAAPIAGRVLDDDGVEALAELSDARIRLQFARALLDLDYVEDAGRLYEAVLQYAPNSYEAHNNLGLVYYKKGSLDEANQRFRRALEIKPDLAEGYYNLGVNAGRQGKLAKAVEHLRKAVEYRHDYTEAHYNLAVAHVKQQDLKSVHAVGCLIGAQRQAAGSSRAISAYASVAAR